MIEETRAGSYIVGLCSVFSFAVDMYLSWSARVLIIHHVLCSIISFIL